MHPKMKTVAAPALGGMVSSVPLTLPVIPVIYAWVQIEQG
jgi:Cu/Ag efflux pump CusA